MYLAPIRKAYVVNYFPPAIVAGGYFFIKNPLPFILFYAILYIVVWTNLRGNLKMKWNDYYKTESELIGAMLQSKSNPEKYQRYQLVKGYEYIESFKKYYKNNGNLSEKQIIQVKRLAGNIYKNLNWECYK